MDELERKLTVDVTKNGKTYTFRRPTAKQLMNADVLAAHYRGNVPINALTYSIALSDMVASLNTYVTDPKGFDFSDLYDDEIGEIYEEVANWLNSFRKPVSKPE